MNPAIVPTELKELVVDALVPGARVQRSGMSECGASWRFEVIWAGNTFELKVPHEEWTDEQHELISLSARLAAPAPEATRGGRGVWIRWRNRRIVGETFSYEFQLFRKPAEPPRTAWVRVAVSSAVTLAEQARQAGHEPHAYLLATVLWELKDRIDEVAELSSGTIGHTVGTEIVMREPATDLEVESYVTQKLRLNYQIGGQRAPLPIDWTDLEYLGISRDEFLRIVALRDRQDWIVNGLSLSPTPEFAQRIAASLIGSDGDSNRG